MFKTILRPVGVQLVKQQQQPVHSLTLGFKNFTTTSTNLAKAKVSPELKKLKKQLDQAKTRHKKTESKLKEHESKVKKLIKERTKTAKQSEKDKTIKEKELEKQKKLIKQALRDPRTYTVFNFYSKITKTPISTLRTTFDNLPSYEQDQWLEATKEFNQLLKKQVTPKPKFGPTSKYQKYVSENYPTGESSNEAMKILASKWKNLTTEEKNSYDVSEDEKLRIKKLQQEWQDKRLKEYPELVKFKENYTFQIKE
ncbi:GCF1 [Candida jiufengensis]|uniref:GCF1 n=1 Tax=Candida jiufengensis TaxID=497108 RepID=UPI002224DDCB|nr:GCF1 [Candida jiufengensis]KAI5951346.1 GCF1 [Candida jiufengensis]